jgi:hypothetical protein
MEIAMRTLSILTASAVAAMLLIAATGAASAAGKANKAEQTEAAVHACQAVGDFCHRACEINNPVSLSGFLSCDLGCTEKEDACIRDVTGMSSPARSFSPRNLALPNGFASGLQFSRD